MAAPVALPSRISKRIEHHNGCWIWTGAKRNGYSMIRWKRDGEHIVIGGHRLLYELHVGPIPEGHEVDHTCRNKACINPAHLEAVTVQENVRRARSHNRSRSHCENGHEMTPENTVIRRRGWKRCRQCGT